MIFKLFVRADYSLSKLSLQHLKNWLLQGLSCYTEHFKEQNTFKITFKTLFFKISWYFNETNNLFNANAKYKVVEFQIHIQSAISSSVQINLLKIISNLA